MWLFGLVLLSLVIWIYLLGFRGQFWRTEPCLEADPLVPQERQPEYPSVCVVIPARDEAEVIATSLRSLLTQEYPGELSIIVVDDHSTDGTGERAQATADQVRAETPAYGARSLRILSAQALPSGWSGKLWAVEQGTQQAMAQSPQPAFLLLTDADIAHDRHNVKRLVDKAIAQNLEMTSVMVRLRCDSLWETLLIPAFVFFFQKLYPFNWANQTENAIAAAAGGCILIRPHALQRIGGIGSIRHALIDDCALAKAVKWHQFPPTPLSAHSGIAPRESNPAHDHDGVAQGIANPGFTAPPHPIWIGLSQKTYSLRPYDNLNTIWDMVARTAYTQLNYSPLLLVGSILGMTIVYLIPVIGLLVGLAWSDVTLASASLVVWGLMAIAYSPIVRFYQRSPFLAVALPGIAFMYTLMTLDSALRYWQGRGGAWKGRTYSPGE